MTAELQVKISLASYNFKKHGDADIGKFRFENPEEFLKNASEIFEGVVLIQTCNRVEILVHGEADQLKKYLESLNRYDFLIFEGSDAIKHLSELASGTQSMIIGEDQILGQLKNALILSEENNCTDSAVSACINTAVKLGVNIRCDTKINRGAVSIGSAAVLLAEELLGNLSGKNILVVGGGEMGKLVSKSLAEKNLRAIYVTNRTYENAVHLAEEIGGRAMHLDQLYPCIALSDVVISCTSAPHPIIRAAEISEVMENRFWPLDDEPRRLIIIDIANPFDVEKECGKILGVNLFTIDDLKGISEKNMQTRACEIQNAEKIIDDYLDGFIKTVNKTAASDILAELYSWAEEIRERECRKALHLIENGDNPKEVLKNLTNSLTKKLLEDASKTIRETAEEKDPAEIRRIVNKITGENNVPHNKA